MDPRNKTSQETISPTLLLMSLLLIPLLLMSLLLITLLLMPLETSSTESSEGEGLGDNKRRAAASFGDAAASFGGDVDASRPIPSASPSSSSPEITSPTDF